MTFCYWLMCFRNDVFRNINLKNYPSQYLSTPVLSWDAMLNITKIKLELISDPDINVFFEKGIRGGVSDISNKYKKTNNKYVKSYYPK